jgi:hypothetical protein
MVAISVFPDDELLDPNKKLYLIALSWFGPTGSVFPGILSNAPIAGEMANVSASCHSARRSSALSADTDSWHSTAPSSLDYRSLWEYGVKAMNTMTYKGYKAVMEYDKEAGLFHGEGVNIRDVITFQGRSADELEAAFAASVETISRCAKSGAKNLRLGEQLTGGSRAPS